MIERDGQFTWEEDNMLGGIRQDVSETARRYRVIENAHLFNEGAVTKDTGITPLSTSTIGSASLDTLAGIDCHFSDGTQKLVVIQEGASSSDAYIFDNGTTLFAAESRTIAKDVRVDLIMFADKLHVIDGTTLQAMDSSTTWSTPGEATYSNPSKFGTVYANRLILSGNSTYPYSFFPSGVRDSTSWDGSLAVDVTSLQGEQITALGVIGSYLIVGGRTFTRAYYLGTASPRDWDYDDVSAQIGPAHHASMVTVPSTHGRSGIGVAMFWSIEGPMMLIQTGQSAPQLISLTAPITRAVRGEDFQGVLGLAIDRYDDVQAVYVPEFDEVRFAVTKRATYSGGTNQNDVLYCVNVNSAIQYAQGAQGAYPFWRTRLNTTANLPVNTVFSARMDPRTHKPSTTGIVRCLCAQNGFVYEMDARNIYEDTIENTVYGVPMRIRRDGYDGVEDGTRNHIKSVRRVYARTTRAGEFDLNVKLLADGGTTSAVSVINLAGPGGSFGLWGDGRVWGDGTVWNAGDFVNARASTGLLGSKFDIEFYDNGNIKAGFQANSFSIMGYVEDRR